MYPEVSCKSLLSALVLPREAVLTCAQCLPLSLLIMMDVTGTDRGEDDQLLMSLGCSESVGAVGRCLAKWGAVISVLGEEEALLQKTRYPVPSLAS